MTMTPESISEQIKEYKKMTSAELRHEKSVIEFMISDCNRRIKCDGHTKSALNQRTYWTARLEAWMKAWESRDQNDN